MKKQAMIEVTVNEDRVDGFPTNYTRSYKWIGDKDSVLTLSSNFSDFYDDDISNFPFKLVKIDEDGPLGFYIRKDSRFWWLRLFWHKAKAACRPINYRLILTAHVWGVVYVVNGARISWRDAWREARKRGKK